MMAENPNVSALEPGPDSKSVIESILQRPAKSASNIRMVKEESSENEEESVQGDVELPEDEEIIEDLSGDDEVIAGDEEVDEQSEDDLIEVTVDGKPEKVSLEALKKSYSGSKYVDSQVQKATERLNEATRYQNNIIQVNQAAMDRLAQIDETLQKIAQPKINWEELKAKDPVAYSIAKEEQRDAQDKRLMVSAEIQRMQQEQQAIQQQAFQHYVQAQVNSLVVKMPHMKDPSKAKVQAERFTKTAVAYEYTPEELANVSDYRAFLVLEDAAKWRDQEAKIKANKGKEEVKGAPKSILRGSTNRAPATIAKQQKTERQMHNRAAASGDPDDVAQLLIVRSKRM